MVFLKVSLCIAHAGKNRYLWQPYQLIVLAFLLFPCHQEESRKPCVSHDLELTLARDSVCLNITNKHSPALAVVDLEVHHAKSLLNTNGLAALSGQWVSSD